SCSCTHGERKAPSVRPSAGRSSSRTLLPSMAATFPVIRLVASRRCNSSMDLKMARNSRMIASVIAGLRALPVGIEPGGQDHIRAKEVRSKSAHCLQPADGDERDVPDARRARQERQYLDAGWRQDTRHAEGLARVKQDGDRLGDGPGRFVASL